MKQNKILILSLLIIAIFAFGCKKDKNVQPHKNEISAKDQAITMKILNFKQKLFAYKEIPNAKDGQAMPVDSAVWYSEALLNYTYDEGLKKQNIFTIRDTLIVKTENGYILYSDLYATYNEMEKVIINQKENHPNANLLFADITSLEGTNGNTSFILTSGLGDDSGGDDYTGWYWGRLLGWCDNSHYGWDAANVIKSNINEDISVPGQGYFTSVSVVYFEYCRYKLDQNDWVYGNFFLNPNWDPNQGYNWYRYLLFWNQNNEPSTYHRCMEPTEINNYTSLTSQIVFDIIPNDLLSGSLEGKSIIGIDLEGDQYYDGDLTTIFHLGSSSYGVFVPTGGGGQ